MYRYIYIYTDLRYTHARVGVADVVNGDLVGCSMETWGPLPPLTGMAGTQLYRVNGYLKDPMTQFGLQLTDPL